MVNGRVITVIYGQISAFVEGDQINFGCPFWLLNVKVLTDYL